NGEPLSQDESKPQTYKHLKSLANSIKEENPDWNNMAVNFDIPTFLRK
ncbi:MAG: hypothetical protein GWM98_27615, partial [Nitrospinaceae bacterium]|nr:hypothetical protein [Nitrospinaceae bacterium]NIR57533.1 hypothetical protein [Nitrospinaceae bacterium]NIS88402.1 hypothetical protein [Nitrospinaceae bacterium]NIT84867.1 hypothetical protein [Nitrospinaceae bacterium]NIU47433.1 hypothetical protein [Nitrospinaceae bacterium]